MDEMVLVIAAKAINEVVKEEGLVNVPIEEIKTLTEEKGFFVKRDRAESDESIRQLIPYIVMQNSDDVQHRDRRSC